MAYMYVLGAGDPEMERIEALLTAAGRQWMPAMSGGRRVHPGAAYKADPVSAPAGTELVLVECGWPGQPADAVVIDHHRPGDPGYGRPAADFLAASSIGQVLLHLRGHDIFAEMPGRAGGGGRMTPHHIPPSRQRPRR